MNRTLIGTLAGLALATGGCAHSNAASAPAPKANPVHTVAATKPAPAPPKASVVHVPFAQLPAVNVPPLRWRYTPAQITTECQQAEMTARKKLAALVAIPDGQRTFRNSFDAFEQIMADYTDAVGRLSFMKEVHPAADVRAAAAKCEESSGKFFVEVGARKDLYLAMKGYLDHQGKVEPLAPIDHRLIQITMRDFRRNGLALSDADRAELVSIRSKIAELQTKYSANLDNDTTSIEATRRELRGMPASYLRRLKKAKDGKYIVTTKYPDYYPLMENDRVEEMRKREWLAFNTREAKKNLPLLTEAVALRDQAAKLLGYKNHADFVTETRMAKSSANVISFLKKLQKELAPGAKKLDARMVAMKRKETHARHAVLQTWDWRYYMHQIRKHDYHLNDEKLRAYFPAPKVLSGMFHVYSTLLGVTFDQVKDPDVWAKGVRLYQVHDALPGPQHGKLLAEFYLDLFPRPGKYGHAASFPIGVSREVKGGYQIPLSAMVVNFNPPENGPAHLSVDEVETLFHEFGHIMHSSLTTVPYNSLAGTNVDVDFVEAPSQMMENFVYTPRVLKLVTEDPHHPGQPMPAKLMKTIARARTWNAPVRYRRQVFLARFDAWIHTHGDHVNVDKVDHMLRKEVVGYPDAPKEHFAASFGHMMGGYDAGYYGYLWSKVFADDMFTRFAKAGVIAPQVGHEYRKDILARGRSVEPEVLLQKFLGRKPNDRAFLIQLGINPDTVEPAPAAAQTKR